MASLLRFPRHETRDQGSRSPGLTHTSAPGQPCPILVLPPPRRSSTWTDRLTSLLASLAVLDSSVATMMVAMRDQRGEIGATRDEDRDPLDDGFLSGRTTSDGRIASRVSMSPRGRRW
jgi:hypothetical protein